MMTCGTMLAADSATIRKVSKGSTAVSSQATTTSDDTTLSKRKRKAQKGAAKCYIVSAVLASLVVLLLNMVHHGHTLRIQDLAVGGSSAEKWWNILGMDDLKLFDKLTYAHRQERVKPAALKVAPARERRYHVREILSRPLAMNRVQVHRLNYSDTLSSISNRTVVTAYFMVRSKHSSQNYDEWMQNFLSILDNVVVFTETQMVKRIALMRRHAPTVIVEMSLNDLPIRLLGNDDAYSTSTNYSFWQHQLDIDRERQLHKSYHVFWIWLSKSWLTIQAIRHNWFDSHFFMWSDIGSFRDRSYNHKQVIQHPEVVPSRTLLWMAHRTPFPSPKRVIWADKRRMRKHFYHSGSQAAGDSQVWLHFHQKFAETLERFLHSRLFIGDDQCILQATCSLYSRLCAYVLHDQVRDNHYFGLRYAMRHGGNYTLWRPPPHRNGAEN